MRDRRIGDRLRSLTKTTTRAAPAKVNLCLRIVDRRPDGYHLLDSIFAAIDLHDTVTISVAPPPSARERHVTVSCSHPGVPNDDRNLAVRAALMLLEASGVAATVDIAIDKRIPPGAGLGGGSSNAATVLRELNALLNLDLPSSRLAELALSLGADVPFFLTGGCARVRGIGEHVEPIPGWPGTELVVVLPDIAVSTAWAFRSHRAEFDAAPKEPAAMASSPTLDPALLRNDLEATVFARFPALAEVKRGLLDAGAAAAVMSGSGSAIVGLCAPWAPARVVRDAFAARHPEGTSRCATILGR